MNTKRFITIIALAFALLVVGVATTNAWSECTSTYCIPWDNHAAAGIAQGPAGSYFLGGKDYAGSAILWVQVPITSTTTSVTLTINSLLVANAWLPTASDVEQLNKDNGWTLNAKALPASDSFIITVNPDGSSITLTPKDSTARFPTRWFMLGVTGKDEAKSKVWGVK